MHRKWGALSLYGALLLAPFVLSLWAAQTAGWAPRPFRDDLASGLAMVGLAAVFVEFVLLGRFKPLSRRLGSDWLMQAHQWFARTAGVFLLAHPLFYSLWSSRPVPWDHSHALSLRLELAPWGLVTGILALGVLGLLVTLAIHRRSLAYARWRLAHAALAVLLVGLALHHTLTLGRYAQLPIVEALWWVLTAGAALSLLWVYVVRPTLQQRQCYRVHSVERLADRLWALELSPPAQGAMVHEAGQFAWLRVQGDRPHEDHPFSIASAPSAGGHLLFLVKEAGDFTRTVGNLQPGTAAWLDGPYGHFTLPTDQRPLVLVAGGIGVAPFVGLLQACAVSAHATRPIRLVYADRDAAQMVDLASLVSLDRLTDFECVRVLEHHGPAAPDTLPGRLDASGMAAVLKHPSIAPCLAEAHVLICGPAAMMDSVETQLLAQGVPPDRIHAEHFQYDFEGRSPLARTARRHWLRTSGGLALGVVLLALLF
jgi:predicted ferric reductase